jgi:two-component system, OmpR family, sensor kinase
MTRLSLRARLLLGLVALTVIGLAVAAVITYEEQRSFLLTRVDQQVGDSRIPVSVALSLIHPQGASTSSRQPTGGSAPGTFQTSGTYGIVVDSSGKVLKSRSFTYGQTPASPPALPRHLPISQFSSHDVHLFTVNSQAGSSLTYRAAAFTLKDGRTLVIAVPLHDVEQTLQRLTEVEALVAGGVILGLLALGWVVIRVGLLPLERIGHVASEIAHGHLDKRVTPANDRTEVGRLGTSLNEMLAQIERAFADRTRSEERLRRFLADASHELRTPLASIRGYAELFRLGAASEPAEIERAMERIEAEATRMGGLVESLLLLARLEELPQAPPVEVDLTELAEHAAQDTRAAAPDREVLVHRRDQVQLLGDPEQLGQVLANLTRNAVVHTPPATPIEITVSSENGQAVIEVRDHGPGLPPNAGEDLFERFWRPEEGRSRGRDGAGLGLAIVKAIADGRGGQVHARNAEDGGAVFRVTLPVTRVAGTEDSPSTRA